MREIIRYTQLCTVIYILGTYTVKKRIAIFLSQKLFPSGERLVSDTTAGTVYNVHPRFSSFHSTLLDNVSYKITQLLLFQRIDLQDCCIL